MYRVGPYEFTEQDARRTFVHLGDLWHHYVHHLPFVPPEAHTAANEVADRLRTATGDAADLAPGVAPETSDDPAVALAELGRTAGALVADGWDHETTVVELEAAWDGIRRVGEALRHAGIFGSSSSGRVTQLNTSSGGVPKLPVPSVEVGWRGVVGDTQSSRQHHGRPWQALCLWSTEVIDGFVAKGHRPSPGSAGENITITGVDWSAMRPGVRVDIGGVRCELTAYAVPCSKNAQWFVDGEFGLMHHHHGPVSRLYAMVIDTGTIDTGDDVVLVP